MDVHKCIHDTLKGSGKGKFAVMSISRSDGKSVQEISCYKVSFDVATLLLSKAGAEELHIQLDRCADGLKTFVSNGFALHRLCHLCVCGKKHATRIMGEKWVSCLGK